MKITVFAAGSRGDIQPCLSLSRGLQQAGYRLAWLPLKILLVSYMNTV